MPPDWRGSVARNSAPPHCEQKVDLPIFACRTQARSDRRNRVWLASPGTLHPIPAPLRRAVVGPAFDLASNSARRASNPSSVSPLDCWRGRLDV